MKLTPKTTTAAVAAAGLLSAGLYVAVPAAANSPESPKAAAPAKPRHHWRQAARGIHGEATVRRDKGFANVSWQRGEITAISGGTLTVRSADGTTWQWKTDKDTRVRKNKAKAAVSALAVKDQAVVAGPVQGSSRTAKRVVVPKK